MTNDRFVAYYRVSTAKQGRSGLGLEAQEAAVLQYLNGRQWKLTGRFVEVESGKRNDRPELAKALAACRRHRATLVIAKLDRLARNVAFISNLMESGVDFVAVDLPRANRLTVHILAAVAEDEAERISARTKAALAAAKARGMQLGGRRHGAEERGQAVAAQGSAAAAARARARAEDLRGVVEELAAEGVTSLRGIAAALNERGIPTPRGGTWASSQVLGLKRLLATTTCRALVCDARSE